MKKIFIISSFFIGGILSAQNSDAKISITEIQKEFKYKKYSTEILTKFVNEIEEVEQVPYVTEFIPGEIIGWNNDRSSYSSEEIFWIKNNELKMISTIPEDETFWNKLNQKAPKNYKFSFENYGRAREAKSIKKSKNGNFILNSEVYLYEENEESNPSKIYKVEYQTKDFKNFTLKKLSKTK